MSQEDRDLQAMKQKQRRASQAEEQAEEEASAPDPEIHEEITAPVQLIEMNREKYDSDESYRQELDSISDRYARDPAYRALWNQFRRQRRESNKSLTTMANAAMEVHQDAGRLGEMVKELKSIADWKRDITIIVSIMKYVLGVVFVVAMGSLIVVATKIYTWGESSGELEIRIQHLEKQLERRVQPQYPFPLPGTQSSGGTNP